MSRARLVIAVALVASIANVALRAQLRKQDRDGGPVQNLSSSEKSKLRDPLFQLVLKNAPNESRLDEIERLLMGTTGARRLFVAHEEILNPALGQTRRVVTTYSGVNKGVQLDPNIALAFFVNDQAAAQEGIEAWGWDDANSRYNYYRLDKQNGEPALTWKFRGSSVGADVRTDAARAGSCFRCHINGAPLMKELPIPWNNWHSFRSPVEYLSATSTSHWKVAESPRFSNLAGAQDLETNVILPSIRQFNGRRVDALSRPAAAGAREVTDGKRLLRPLFVSTEYNITSADQPSGLHPFPALGGGPAAPVRAPDTFFLNANLLAGGGFTRYQGLKIVEARQFASVLDLQPAEYRAVVEFFNTTLNGEKFDANFAWLVPEASHVDNQLVDILVRRGIITAEFAAAALAVDVETPVFSDARASLLTFVPQKFTFKPRGPDDVPPTHPDALTRTVIASIRAGAVPAGSPQEQFVTLLEDPAPLDKVRAMVVAYATRVRGVLQNPTQRQAEIRRLYKLMLDRRKTAASRIPELVESEFLFPSGS